MMNLLPLLLLPIIGAFIGWFTNYLAIKMLLYPREPKRFLGIKLQGVLPKRQQALAEEIGNLVSQELFSSKDLIAELRQAAKAPEMLNILHPKIERLILEKLPKRFPPLKLFFNNDMVETLQGVVMQLLNPVIDILVDKAGRKLEEQIDVQQMVEEKIAAFSHQKMEALVYQIMRREFRFIEYAGAALGLVIGLAQLAVLQAF